MNRFSRHGVAVAALALTAGVLAPPVHADAPDFVSGFGITVHGTQQVTDRQLVVDIDTPAVAPTAIRGPHQVRVILPDGYDQHPTLRYPVVYLLHGGGDARSDQWVEGGGVAEQLTAGAPVITVLPEGGRVGWYTDWVDPGEHTQRWAEFHLDQLVPWIDANLRTVDAKRGRAIAGLSMGGFGAINYAARRPDLFAYAASFSGALDLADAGIRAVVTEEASRLLGRPNGPFGSPVWSGDGAWNANNPLQRTENLRDVAIALYAGSGINDVDVVERTVGASTHRMHLALDAAGIGHHYENYGRPAPGAKPFNCDGGHNFSCWNYTLQDVLPRMLAVLDHP